MKKILIIIFAGLLINLSYSQEVYKSVDDIYMGIIQDDLLIIDSTKTVDYGKIHFTFTDELIIIDFIKLRETERFYIINIDTISDKHMVYITRNRKGNMYQIDFYYELNNIELYFTPSSFDKFLMYKIKSYGE